MGRLPEGLLDTAPGPELGALLATIDRSALHGHDVIDLVCARYRQLCFVQAQFFADVVEALHCPPNFDDDGPPVRSATMDRFAPDVLACALSWTSRAADYQTDLAWQIVERLPTLHAAMLAGLIDVPKAKVLADGVCHLDEDLARRVVDEILPLAAELTTGRLRGRLDRLILKLDPAAAKQRRDEKIERRAVVRYPDGDGTATITALGLPVERAARAMERLDTLAQTARVTAMNAAWTNCGRTASSTFSTGRSPAGNRPNAAAWSICSSPWRPWPG